MTLSHAGSDPIVFPKDDIPTPRLLVDLDLFESNLRKMASHCQSMGCSIRPHAKTHKCPEIARRQVAAGAVGISTATVAEAEAMVATGIPGVLLTSPIVEPVKIQRMVDLAVAGGEILLAVGHHLEVDILAECCRGSANIRMDVLIDLDVGDRRFGCLPGPPALELARRIGQRPMLQIRGVQAYLGLAAHVEGFEARERTSLEAMSRAVETREELLKAGFNAGFLSCASTGTYNIDCKLPGPIELQSGSYIFMDVEYRGIGGRGGSSLFDDFERSLTVLTTVVSASHADRVTVDAGVKSFATDSANMPEAKGHPGLSYQFHGDEFGRITASPGADLPRLGGRIEFYAPALGRPPPSTSTTGSTPSGASLSRKSGRSSPGRSDGRQGSVQLSVRSLMGSEDRLDPRAVMFQRRDFQSRDLRHVIPATKLDCLLAEGVGREPIGFLRAHWPTLEPEAGLRGGRQGFEIGRLDRAEVTLGIHMKLDRANHFGPEMGSKPGGPFIFMKTVATRLGDVFREVVDQVSDVVKQARHDQGVGGPLAFGEVGDLQGVLQLRDRLAEVGRIAPRLEQAEDDFHQILLIRSFEAHDPVLHWLNVREFTPGRVVIVTETARRLRCEASGR